MLIHLFFAKLEAIQIQIEKLIDDRYRKSGEGENFAMPKNFQDAKYGLKALISSQPKIIRFYFLFFFTQNRKEKLIDFWIKKSKMSHKEIQTRESSFEARMYGIGSVKEEFRKSRDDVNSLVASLDFTLRPQQTFHQPFNRIPE